jgi:hypothetical protein
MVSMPLATSPPVLLDGATASPPTDNYTTALAALIAGSSDHDFGGAAPGSPLLAISVLDENLNATNAAIAAGVDRAALGGARVTCLAHGSMERSEVIDDALADAVEAGSWSSRPSATEATCNPSTRPRLPASCRSARWIVGGG